MANLIQEEKLKVKETVVEGFEKMPEAFIGLFNGSNTGKMVVKIKWCLGSNVDITVRYLKQMIPKNPPNIYNSSYLSVKKV